MVNTFDREQLRQWLSDQFELVCFADLADLRALHGSVFELFDRCYKPEYHDRERLVLYTNELPEQRFLDHIQYAAASTDISNFFILVVSPHDLSQSLEIANQRHGHDHVRMQCMVVRILDGRPYDAVGFADTAFLCPLPFMAAQIDPSGDVAPCCKYQGSCGSLKTAPLQEIFNGSRFREIRQQMTLGQQPPGCATCGTLERAGEHSPRQSMMLKYGRILHTQCLDDPHIVALDVFPSSVCNFKCRICQPFYSTSIRSEEIRFAKDQNARQQIRQQFPVHNHAQVRSVFSDPSIQPEFVHILGGETFLWPELPAIVDHYINNGTAKNLQIEFNTNGSIYPPFLEKAVGQFKMIEILISLDDVGTRFELQRGGAWVQVLENLTLFAALNRAAGINVRLAPTVNIQNVLYLDDVVDLAADLGFGIVWWDHLEKPWYLSIDHVTPAVKQRIRELYQNHAVPELRALADRVTKTEPVSGDAFLAYTAKIDQRRRQNFYESHREICELMKTPVQ